MNASKMKERNNASCTPCDQSEFQNVLMSLSISLQNQIVNIYNSITSNQKGLRDIALARLLYSYSIITDEIGQILDRFVALTSRQIPFAAAELRTFLVKVDLNPSSTLTTAKIPMTHYIPRLGNNLCDEDGKVGTRAKIAVFYITEYMFLYVILLLLRNGKCSSKDASEITEKYISPLASEAVDDRMAVIYAGMAHIIEGIIFHLSEVDPRSISKLFLRMILSLNINSPEQMGFTFRTFRSISPDCMSELLNPNSVPELLKFISLYFNCISKITTSPVKSIFVDAPIFMTCFLNALTEVRRKTQFGEISKAISAPAMEDQSTIFSLPICCYLFTRDRSTRTTLSLQKLLQTCENLVRDSPELTPAVLFSVRILMTPYNFLPLAKDIEAGSSLNANIDMRDFYFIDSFLDFLKNLNFNDSDQLSLFLSQLCSENLLLFLDTLFENHFLVESDFLRWNPMQFLGFIHRLFRFREQFGLSESEFQYVMENIFEAEVKFLDGRTSYTERDTIPCFSLATGNPLSIFDSTVPSYSSFIKGLPRASDIKKWKSELNVPYIFDVTSTNAPDFSRQFKRTCDPIAFSLASVPLLTPSVKLVHLSVGFLFHPDDHICNIAASNLFYLSHSYGDEIIKAIGGMGINNYAEMFIQLKVLDFLLQSVFFPDASLIYPLLIVGLAYPSVIVRTQALNLMKLLPEFLEAVEKINIDVYEMAIVNISNIAHGKYYTVKSIPHTFTEIASWNFEFTYTFYYSSFLKLIPQSLKQSIPVNKLMDLLHTLASKEEVDLHLITNILNLLLQRELDENQFRGCMTSLISAIMRSSDDPLWMYYAPLIFDSITPTYLLQAFDCFVPHISNEAAFRTLCYLLRKMSNFQTFSSESDVLQFMAMLKQLLRPNLQCPSVMDLLIAIKNLSEKIATLPKPYLIHKSINADYLSDAFSFVFNLLNKKEDYVKEARETFAALCSVTTIPDSLIKNVILQLAFLLKTAPVACRFILSHAFEYFLPFFIELSFHDENGYLSICNQFPEDIEEFRRDIQNQDFDESFGSSIFYNIGYLIALGHLYGLRHIKLTHQLFSCLIAVVSLVRDDDWSPLLFASLEPDLRNFENYTSKFTQYFGFCSEQVIAVALKSINVPQEFYILMEPWFDLINLKCKTVGITMETVDSLVEFTHIDFVRALLKRFYSDMSSESFILRRKILDKKQNVKRILPHLLLLIDELPVECVRLGQDICNYPEYVKYVASYFTFEFWFHANIQSHSYERFFDFESFLSGDYNEENESNQFDMLFETQNQNISFAADVLCPLCLEDKELYNRMLPLFASFILTHKEIKGLPDHIQPQALKDFFKQSIGKDCPVSDDLIPLMTPSQIEEFGLLCFKWGTSCGDLNIALHAVKLAIYAKSFTEESITVLNRSLHIALALTDSKKQLGTKEVTHRLSTLFEFDTNNGSKELYGYIGELVGLIGHVGTFLKLPCDLVLTVLRLLSCSTAELKPIFERALEASVRILEKFEYTFTKIPESFQGILSYFAQPILYTDRKHGIEMAGMMFRLAYLLLTTKNYRVLFNGAAEEEAVEAAAKLFLLPIKGTNKEFIPLTLVAGRELTSLVVVVYANICQISTKYSSAIITATSSIFNNSELVTEEAVSRLAHVLLKDRSNGLNQLICTFLSKYQEEFEFKGQIQQKITTPPFSESYMECNLSEWVPGATTLPPLLPNSQFYNLYSIVKTIRVVCLPVEIQPFTKWVNHVYNSETLSEPKGQKPKLDFHAHTLPSSSIPRMDSQLSIVTDAEVRHAVPSNSHQISMEVFTPDLVQIAALISEFIS